jgi:hypothetical protein
MSLPRANISIPRPFPGAFADSERYIITFHSLSKRY